MKRDEAIAPLSRDHHATLILAQLLKKNAPAYQGLPTPVADKAKYAQEQFAAHIKKHFQQEETILNNVKDTDTEIGKLSEEIKNEHRQITDLFHALDTATDRENTMNTLGIALEKHIRKEERILFPLLQLHRSEEHTSELQSQ